MSYADILILGWNLNAMMFVVNLFLAINVMKTTDMDEVEKENQKLSFLKQEFDSYYPNRKYETMVSYLIPFTAFYRISFKLLEMSLFFSRNKGTRMFDFIVYKYQTDIEKAKNHKEG
jgi:hypothetical protein